MTVLQYKKFYDLYGVYELFVVLLQQTVPLALRSVSTKPLWIYGRGGAGETRPQKVPAGIGWMQKATLCATSIGWKEKGDV